MQINRHRHDPSKVDDILLVDINAYRGTHCFPLLTRISNQERAHSPPFGLQSLNQTHGHYSHHDGIPHSPSSCD